MACAPSEDSDQPGHLPSLIRVVTVHSMGSWRPKLSSCGQRRLIRLGGCPGWSESLLGAHTILLVLSRGGSNIHRLLNLYCEIFGTSSYGERRTSLRVRLRHMNECRIFHNINSITFLSYILKMFILRSIMLLTTTSVSNQCFKWPQFMANSIFSTAKQHVHTHAKPYPLA